MRAEAGRRVEAGQRRPSAPALCRGSGLTGSDRMPSRPTGARSQCRSAAAGAGGEPNGPVAALCVAGQCGFLRAEESGPPQPAVAGPSAGSSTVLLRAQQLSAVLPTSGMAARRLWRRADGASAKDVVDRGAPGGRNCRPRAALFAWLRAGRVADTPISGAIFHSFLDHPSGGLGVVPVALTGALQGDN